MGINTTPRNTGPGSDPNHSYQGLADRKYQPKANAILQNSQAMLQQMAAERPGLDTSLIQSYVRQFDAYQRRHDVLMEQLSNGGDKAALMQQESQLRQQFQQQFGPQYNNANEGARTAFAEFQRRTKPRGMIDGITDNFYDKDKGEIKWGGIIGAIGGGLLGMSLGGGGTIGIIIALIGAFAGATLGNKASEFIGNHVGTGSGPTFPGGQQPQRTPGQQRTAEMPMAQNTSFTPQNLSAQAHQEAMRHGQTLSQQTSQNPLGSNTSLDIHSLQTSGLQPARLQPATNNNQPRGHNGRGG